MALLRGLKRPEKELWNELWSDAYITLYIARTCKARQASCISSLESINIKEIFISFDFPIEYIQRQSGCQLNLTLYYYYYSELEKPHVSIACINNQLVGS